MLRNRTSKVAITLPRARWDEVVDAMLCASMSMDGPGWCFCPEAEDDLCQDCGRREVRACEYRESAHEIERTLGDRLGLITLPYSISSWKLVYSAVSDGTSYETASLGYDCRWVGCAQLCTECLAHTRTIQRWQATGRGISRRVNRTSARPARATRKPRGTRPAYRH